MIIPKLRMLLKVSSCRDFFTVFFATLGTISSIVTLISFVYQLQNPSLHTLVVYAVTILFVCFAISCSLTHRKQSLTFNISNTLHVNVAEGDLFEKGVGRNFIVIPVNEYFDTTVDNKIVSESTLHGQFIRRFYNYQNSNTLHQEIDSYLCSHPEISCIEMVRTNSHGNTKQYPLGTCVPIIKGQVTYVLLALTHFDENDIAYVELSEFGRCISSLCKFLGEKAGNNPVYLPLMGMGLSRLNQPAQFILKYTLDTIIGIKGLSIPGGLNIVVYPPIAKTLNLNEINY